METYISLLYVVYKVASTCIANRLNTVSSYVEYKNHTGCIARRCMGHNSKQINHIICQTKDKQILDLLLQVDLSMLFIRCLGSLFNQLDYFKFVPSFRMLVKVIEREWRRNSLGSLNKGPGRIKRAYADKNVKNGGLSISKTEEYTLKITWFRLYMVWPDGCTSCAGSCFRRSLFSRVSKHHKIPSGFSFWRHGINIQADGK